MGRIVGLLVAAFAVVGAAAGAKAQAPDIRDVRPLVMLLVDTSGSMEKLPACVCSTPACTECRPTCTSVPGTSDRNRWTTVLEALTGTMSDFTCSTEDRSAASYVGQYDYGYYLPHFRSSYATQLTDGILDGYMDRVKFGLMTFDGFGTFTDTSPLVTSTIFTARLTDSRSSKGDFSYGEPRPFSLPGCAEPYMLDNGARNESASVGRLVSVGSDLTSDYTVINADIQSVLLSTRPFGATPIAGMLDDVRYYFENHPDVARVDTSGSGDSYFQCRSRYVLLLTDGYPNADMREPPYDCGSAGASCPYDRPEEIAADLCSLSGATGGCDGLVDGLFVVGFDIADPAAIARLNDIASLGGTGGALFADDRGTLMARLSAALDAAAPGTTTRTVPTFTSPQSSAGAGQHQFNTGFNVGSEDGTRPWRGVLERRRFLCDGLTVEEQPVETEDKFHETLNARTAPRRLLTVVPSDYHDVDGHLVGEDTGVTPIPTGSTDVSGGRGRGPGGAPAVCGGGGGGGGGPSWHYTGPDEEGLALEDFSVANARLTIQHLGVSTSAERSAVIQWIHGTGREDAKLGDIYHSSPVVVGPPTEDLPDESYNLFRQREEVANRPTVLFVGTNDGILHAFATEDVDITAGPHAGTRLHAGEELWGFIPPVVLPRLQSAMASHQYLVDGTPLVKDVFLKRLPGAASDGGIWRTVMIVPLGRGAGGYVALDVTDPLEPEFMWQFNHPDMGATLGAPALAQVLVNAGGELQERALALLPAGAGEDLTSYDSSGRCAPPEPMPDGRMSKPIGCPGRGKGRPPVTEGTLRARENQRCWSEKGRSMFFVDPATGELVKVMDDTTFNAPLTGGMSVYTGDVATIATRAFFTDDDGVIWRLDLASPDIADWDAAPFHDIFWDGEATDGQPAYYPPILSTDTNGRVVVIQATGRIDALDGFAANRVVSLTEELEFDAASGATDTVAASLNWEIKLEAGEQVTGPLELFEGHVYFGSFVSAADTTDACAYGYSRLWGVHYRDTESGTTDPTPAFDEDGDGDPETSFIGPLDNQVIMGVAITQRPSCFEGATEIDPYDGDYYRLTASEPGAFQLVAQVSGGGSRPVGGAVGEIVRALPSPQSFTLPASWAGTVD